MNLSDVNILKENNRGRLIIDPLDLESIQPASVDLTLSDDLRLFYRFDEIDPRKNLEYTYPKRIPEEGFLIKPGQFVLGSVAERVSIPENVVARVEGKSSLGRMGLLVHATAGFIDPGFEGQITLELYNLNHSSIRLYSGMKIAQISFSYMLSSPERPYGSPGLGSKYQHQTGTTPSLYFKNVIEEEENL